MKYIDKVIKTNADGEQYHHGYKVEITKLELSYLKLALTYATECDIKDPVYSTLENLENQFKAMELQAAKGNVNVELEHPDNGLSMDCIVIDEAKGDPKEYRCEAPAFVLPCSHWVIGSCFHPSHCNFKKEIGNN